MSLTNPELNISLHYCHLLKFLKVQQFFSNSNNFSQTLFCTHFATFLSGVTVVFYCFHNKLPQAQWFKRTQLNHLHFQSSGIQNGSRWPNIKVSAGLCLLWRFQGGNLVFWPCPASRSFLFVLLWSLCFSLFCLLLTSITTLLITPPHTHKITQDEIFNLDPIFYLNTSLSCKVTYFQVLEI